MTYKGAIFDMDGVLFDTERLYQETWKEIADERNIKLGQNFGTDITGTSGKHMLEIIEKYYQVPDGSVVANECLERMKKKLSEQVPMKKGVHEILEFFREQGVRMIVASSSVRQQIESNLKNSGLLEYFEDVVSGAEVKHGKPAPDIFLRAAEKIDCRPEDCYVFEDSKNGVKAGHAAGCKTIMIPDLIEPTPEIIPLCYRICRDFHQVREEII